jgi:hypothetical protein
MIKSENIMYISLTKMRQKKMLLTFQLELVRWCEVKIIIEFYFFYNDYITCYIFNCIKYLTTNSYRIAIYFKTIYYVML